MSDSQPHRLPDAAGPSPVPAEGAEADVTPDQAPPDGGDRGKILFRVDQLRLARIIFGIVSLGVSIAYLVGALGMPQGTGAQPGPGMWPSAVGAAWVIISLVVIAEAAFTRQVSGSLDLPVGIYARDVIVFSVATVAYVLLLPILGQYAAGSLYCVALVKFLSRLPWWRAILYGLLLAISISWIFLNLLQVHLPEGIVPQLLGF